MSFQQNITLQHITAEETLPLRMTVLRPGQLIENCRYKEDSLPSTFHLGALINGKIVCNGTFMKDVCSYFTAENSAYRLRGMATDPDFRGLQLGSSLLQEAEDILRLRGCKILWFNARETAFIFYEKNSFVAVGDLFDISTVGPHKVMYKWL
ncbi:MAG: GNAT family N-acetyltransferase [Bdellovibrionaceae bacterium]|nr:GNAT family N-acetyltransferase [Pseudobdellovibrionaceae bacterium]